MMKEKLIEIISNYVDLDGIEITEDSKFIGDLGFNSYEFMSMLGELESAFNIEFDEAEVVKIHTIKEAVDYMSSLIVA